MQRKKTHKTPKTDTKALNQRVNFTFSTCTAGGLGGLSFLDSSLEVFSALVVEPVSSEDTAWMHQSPHVSFQSKTLNLMC